MAGTSTKEHCRVCGEVTLHRISTKVPGFIMWKVICPKCQKG